MASLDIPHETLVKLKDKIILITGSLTPMS